VSDIGLNEFDASHFLAARPHKDSNGFRFFWDHDGIRKALHRIKEGGKQ
jgi:hypothetical protein